MSHSCHIHLPWCDTEKYYAGCKIEKYWKVLRKQFSPSVAAFLGSGLDFRAIHYWSFLNLDLKIMRIPWKPMVDHHVQSCQSCLSGLLFIWTKRQDQSLHPAMLGPQTRRKSRCFAIRWMLYCPETTYICDPRKRIECWILLITIYHNFGFITILNFTLCPPFWSSSGYKFCGWFHLVLSSL